MNGDDSSSKSLAHSTSSAAHSIRIHAPSSPIKRKSPSASRRSSSLPNKSLNSKESTNHAGAAAGDATSRNEESEAETEILSAEEELKTKPSRKDTSSTKRVDARMSSPVTTKSEPSQSTPSSRRASLQDPVDPSDKRKQGSKARPDGDAKHKSSTGSARASSRPLATSTRAQSAEVATSRASPTSSESAAAVTKFSARSRESSSVEPRKRKLSVDNSRSKFEPPRQRLRLDAASKQNASGTKQGNGSPASPVVNSSSHRRSASTQSAVVKASRKKKREASTHSQASDSKERWEDDSTDDSSVAGHKDPPIPHLAPPRSSRLASRALNSPVRTAPAPSRRADKYGTTPLAKACEKGEIEDVEIAYQRAPEEIDKADYGGYTPLQKASLNGSYEVVKFLLDNGCKTDCCSKEERDTPLIDAVENDHIDVVKLLLDRGVNPHVSNVKGNRAIDSIQENGEHAEEIRAALEQAMKDYQVKDEDHEQPSSEVSHPNPQRANGKLSTRPDLLYQQPNLPNLLRYSLKGDLEAVVMFLESVGADNACAVAAARGGHYDVLSFILASNSVGLPRDPDPAKFNDETPLLVAIGRGHINIITLLLDQDNFNPTRKTTSGQTYYEVAEARRGPRWQAEVDLLKERFDQYVEKYPNQNSSPRVVKKKRQPESKIVQSPVSERHNGPKSPRLVKTKLKGDDQPEERKAKRSSTGKDTSQRDAQRRKRRVIDDDDSSPEDGSDTVDRRNKVLQRRRASSSASKPTRNPEDKSSSHRKSEDTNNAKSKSSSKIKNAAKIKSEPSHEDRDVVMADARDSSSDVGEPDSISQKEAELVKQLQIERRKLEEIEAQAQADAAAREAIAQARMEAEALKRREKEEEDRKLAHETYLESLPLAIRRAIEIGDNRPLRLTSYADDPDRPQRLGILNQFAPLLACPQDDLVNPTPIDQKPNDSELWTLSFYLIGFLGISDFSLDAYDGPRIAATPDQLAKFFQLPNMPQLAYDDKWTEMGQYGYDHISAQETLKSTRQKCLNMSPMWWLPLENVLAEIRKQERFRDVKIRWQRSNALCQRKTNKTPASFWDVFDKQPTSAASSRFARSPVTPNGFNSQAASPVGTTATTPLLNGLNVNGEPAA